MADAHLDWNLLTQEEKHSLESLFEYELCDLLNYDELVALGLLF